MRKLQNDNPADELYARLAQALRYLDHPEVQAIPFALHASVVAAQCTAAIERYENEVLLKP
jgi:hypothetical protein